ncbi:hypothetical protein MMC13_000542 [Lambiella insularis]|nr:hypothetical protein [Lambiella insularis]
MDDDDTESVHPTGPEAGDEEEIRHAEWKALFNFTSRAHVLPLTIAICLSVASGIVIPALAIFLGKIFDKFAAYGAGTISGSDLTHQVSMNGLYLLGLGSASWLLNGSYFMFWLFFGELQAKSVREKLFGGMLQKDMEWYDMRKSGVNAMIPRLQTQIRELQIATSQPLGFAVQYTVTLIAALGLAFYTAWNLTLVTVALVPFTAVALAWVSARMQPAIEQQIEQLTQASKLANNAITAIDTVKCFNGQDFELGQYLEATKKAAFYYLVQARANALQIGLVRVSVLGMFVQGFWYGSHLVDTGSRTPGQILTAFWACLMATQTMEQLLPQMIVLEKGRVAAATLQAVRIKVDRGQRVRDMIGRKAPRYCDGDIQVKRVSFAYPSRPNHLVVKDASFFFPAGETTFVIGKSGSGKSTLGNLLLQFYPAASGEITIDGESIQVLDSNWLRNNITLVQQSSVLFNETIFTNIAFGRRDHESVRREEVKRCMEAAALRDTILALPKGLDTLVGIGGSAMSGGQKQRVAIARARLRDTPILILDEATSALDHTSRTLVMEAIRAWRKGKTTIIITHDISQIQEEDYAYIIDKGRIVQEGYRAAMEKVPDGAFAGFLHPGVEFLNEPLRKPPKSYQRRSAFLSTLRESPRTSVGSNDSMDIRIPQKSTPILNAYYPSSENVRPKRQSLSFSTLPPMAMHMNRMSNARLSMASFRNFPRPLPSPTPVPSSSQIELQFLDQPGDADSGEKPAAKQRSTIRRFSDYSLLEAFTTPKPPRLKALRTFVSRFKKSPISPETISDISSLKTILSTVWPTLTRKHRVILVCGFIAAFAHAGATPVFSWVFSKLLGTFFLATGRSHQSLIWSMSVLGVAVGDATASYLMHYLLEVCGQAWVDSLRIEAMKRILDQPRSWFDDDTNSLSTLTECLDRNAEEMRNLVGRFAGFLFVASTMMAIAFIWSLAICWKLTLVGLATAPVMYAVTRGFEAVSGKWEGRCNDASEAAGAIFHETFVNIRTVRALTLEGYFHKKYNRATAHAMRTGLRRAAYSGLFFGISDASIIFITALIFYYGSLLAASNAFSAQDILTVFSMLLFSIANVNAIVAFSTPLPLPPSPPTNPSTPVPQINSSRSTATRLLRLASLPLHASHEHSGTIRLPALPGPLSFHNLTFAYPQRPTHPALHNLTLTIPLHTATALVGPSGSGKSTLAALLLRLYPSTPASALTTGYPPTTNTTTTPHSTATHHSPAPLPLSALHLPTYRALCALVPQAPLLFPTTLLANIAYGLPASSPLATPAAIAAAASRAGIHTFIASLPSGYNTVVGDGGLGLSGGQTQRVGIARALARRPGLLVMDEPTSGLDAEAAEEVRRLVGELVREGITVVVVTHSWEMMRACGGCVVLEGGRVVERGGWGELRGREGGVLRGMLGEG